MLLGIGTLFHFIYMFKIFDDDICQLCVSHSQSYVFWFLGQQSSFVIEYNYLQIVPVKTIKDEFPFHRFFDDAPKPLFKCQSYEEDMEVAEGCFRWVMNISLQLLLFEFQGFSKIMYFFFQTLEVQNLATCSNQLANVLKYLPMCTQGKSCDLGCAG